MNQTEQTSNQFFSHRQRLRGEGREMLDNTRGVELRATEQKEMVDNTSKAKANEEKKQSIKKEVKWNENRQSDSNPVYVVCVCCV